MPHHIPLVKHAVRRDGNGMLFQVMDIRAPGHTVQNIIGIGFRIAVLALYHIGQGIPVHLLFPGKPAAVDNTCGMDIFKVSGIDFQRRLIVLRFHHQVEFLGMQITLHCIAPDWVRDLQQFGEKIYIGANAPAGKFLFHQPFQPDGILRVGKQALLQFFKKFLAIRNLLGNLFHLRGQHRPVFLNLFLLFPRESLQLLYDAGFLFLQGRPFRLLCRLSQQFRLRAAHRPVIQLCQIPQIGQQMSQLFFQPLLFFLLFPYIVFQFPDPALGLFQQTAGLIGLPVHMNRQNLLLQSPQPFAQFLREFPVGFHGLAFYPDVLLQILHLQPGSVPACNFKQQIVDQDAPFLFLDLPVFAQNFLQSALLPPGALQNPLQFAERLYILPQGNHIHPLFRQHEFVDEFFYIVHGLKCQGFGNYIKEFVVQIPQAAFETVSGSIFLLDIRQFSALYPELLRQRRPALHPERQILQPALLHIPACGHLALLIRGKHMYTQDKIAVSLLFIEFQSHIGRYRVFPQICLPHIPHLTADIAFQAPVAPLIGGHVEPPGVGGEHQLYGI